MLRLNGKSAVDRFSKLLSKSCDLL